jgi:hypothetical protein
LSVDTTVWVGLLSCTPSSAMFLPLTHVCTLQEQRSGSRSSRRHASPLALLLSVLTANTVVGAHC